jgi:hypothetical protein
VILLAFEISGSHGGEYDDSFVGYSTVQSRGDYTVLYLRKLHFITFFVRFWEEP